jgi:hypothetical protein
MPKLLLIFFIVFFCCRPGDIAAQDKKDSITKSDSLLKNNKKVPDTAVIKKFTPRTATIRSAMLPGWGQIYNKKYWKLPLVYGALGTTAAIFFYNIKTYKLLKLAYLYKSNILYDPNLIDPQFRNFSASSLKTYRNQVRQNVDYSVLFFILFWGLNVVDATVDAQLKAFDVNDNLSLKLTPGYSPLANTSGISLVFDFHSKHIKGAK